VVRRRRTIAHRTFALQDPAHVGRLPKDRFLQQFYRCCQKVREFRPPPFPNSLSLAHSLCRCGSVLPLSTANVSNPCAHDILAPIPPYLVEQITDADDLDGSVLGE